MYKDTEHAYTCEHCVKKTAFSKDYLWGHTACIHLWPLWKDSFLHRWLVRTNSKHKPVAIVKRQFSLKISCEDTQHAYTCDHGEKTMSSQDDLWGHTTCLHLWPLWKECVLKRWLVRTHSMPTPLTIVKRQFLPKMTCEDTQHAYTCDHREKTVSSQDDVWVHIACIHLWGHTACIHLWQLHCEKKNTFKKKSE